MISATLLTMLSAIAILITAMVLGLWQILSAPDRPNYPTSGTIKRAMMFLLVVMLAGRGVELLTTLAGPYPVLSTPWQAAASFALCALFIVFLIDHCRNWLPAKTHRNIQRLYRIARCSPSPGLKAARAASNKAAGVEPQGRADMASAALVELAMQGVRVAGPNEGPEAFTDN
jgi:hypothetical protein